MENNMNTKKILIGLTLGLSILTTHALADEQKQELLWKKWMQEMMDRPWSKIC
jgi:hypothetical protein